MPEKILQKSIQYLKGVGEKRAELYKKLGVFSINTLLHYYPRKYIDFLNHYNIADAPLNETVAVKATVTNKSSAYIRKNFTVFKITCKDDDVNALQVTLYNQKFSYDKLEIGEEYIFYGKVEGSFFVKTMSSPVFMPVNKGNKIRPIYPSTNGLSSAVIESNVKNALTLMGDNLADPLPNSLREQRKLCHLNFAIQNIHFPQNEGALQTARHRLMFDELFYLQLGFGLMRQKNQKAKNTVKMKATPRKMKPFWDNLPFTPTGDQKKTVQTCIEDMGSSTIMNRLVQGDVGSGKTLVAQALLYFSKLNGVQAAFMAPTEILANQLYNNTKKVLEPLGVTVALLTGSLKKKEKGQLLEALADGRIDIVVGTHALLTDTVNFYNLGLVITDEQHRFGVKQRAALSNKGKDVHTLVMSATPIPRTLALMVYGDLDVSVIKELPKGRKPIDTFCIPSSKRERSFHFIKEHLDKGQQAFVVCPLVEEGDTEGLKSVTEYAETLQTYQFKDYKVGILHGKMKAKDKDEMMLKFLNKELHLLVATTVIEVGIDIPNATVILIENAERFGLSALHQLRGRVGRGSEQSYCILVSDSQNPDTIKRLKAMTETNDGFEIAQTDLSIRGPGDFFGQRQHGLPTLKIADLAENMEFVTEIGVVAREFLKTDPNLSKTENKGIFREVAALFEQEDHIFN